MELLLKINQEINRIIWGPHMPVLFVGTGVFLTAILGFPQIRYFLLMFREVLGKIFRRPEGKGAITPFQALATALSSTVGVGNIAGVATALHLGGPGALFWMVVSAFFGMATKMSEVALAVRFREEEKPGLYRGGTMYILEKAVGMKWLAWLFAFCAMIEATLGGNAIQSNSVAEGMNLGFGIPHMATGVVIAILTALVIIGGLRSIAKVTQFLVPGMSLFYIVGGLIVIFTHVEAIPEAFRMMVKYAFHDPRAIPGALAGWTIKMAITKGVARGIFSNEAGLGSAPMVHATAITDHPIRQGLYGLFEVFLDTLVICMITGLSILTTGVLFTHPDLTGAKLTMSAFETVLGKAGSWIMAIGLALFAYSTILGWYWYGETAADYIFGPKVIPFYKAVWIAMILLGAAAADKYLDPLWNLTDTANGLMALPNLFALLLLSFEVRRLVKDFDRKRLSGR